MDLQIPPTIWDIAKIVLGALVALLVTGLRQRRVRLNWHVAHSTIGTSRDVPGVGKIEVRLDGEPKAHLVVTVATVVNGYARDLSDLIVRVSVPKEHVILRDEALRSVDAKRLNWSSGFLDQLAFAKTDAGKNSDIYRWREYAVPILNRGETLTVTLLVNAHPPTVPRCDVGIDQLGILLRETRSKEAQIFDVPVFRALGAGILVWAPLAYFVPEARWQEPLLILIGMTTAGMGALAVRLYRWMRSRIL